MMRPHAAVLQPGALYTERRTGMPRRRGRAPAARSPARGPARAATGCSYRSPLLTELLLLISAQGTEAVAAFVRSICTVEW